MNIFKGKYFIYISVLVTFILWALSKPQISNIVQDPTRSVSQIFALVGLLFMMVSVILSTRKRFIEDLFGGLDRVYNVHHIIGSVSFILLINHPLFLIIKVIPKSVLMSQYLFLGTSLAYNLGIFSLYIMIVSFIFILFIKLPYHWWFKTHQLLGLAAILGGMHALLIESDISSFMPLRLWMSAWIILGSVSFFYTFVYYKTLGRIYAYTITKIEQILDVITIYGKPVGKKISFLPGQFAYVGFSNPHLGSEQHPFSFSAAPHEESVRFCAKMLGDYTVNLPHLKEGDNMYIKGPYGTFGNMYLQNNFPLVWIIGGIGITPFLSMLRNQQNLKNKREILICYCYSKPDEGMFSEEIRKLIVHQPGVKLFPWCSAEKGRFSVEHIVPYLKKFSYYQVQLCGPGPMMESIVRQFKQIGVSEDRIRFESFQMI